MQKLGEFILAGIAGKRQFFVDFWRGKASSLHGLNDGQIVVLRAIDPRRGSLSTGCPAAL